MRLDVAKRILFIALKMSISKNKFTKEESYEIISLFEKFYSENPVTEKELIGDSFVKWLDSFENYVVKNSTLTFVCF